MTQNEFSILDALPVEIFILQNSSLETLFINQAAKTTYGVTEKDLPSFDYLTLHPAEEQGIVKQILTRHQMFCSDEFNQYTVQGILVPVELSVNFAVSGEKEIIIIVVRVIEQVKKREKYLTEQLEYFREAKKIAAMGRWDFDHENQIFHFSDTMFPILGIHSWESQTGWMDYLKYIHKEDRNKVIKNWNKSIRRKEIFQSEHRIITQSGETRWVSEIYKTRTTSAGEPLHTTGIVQDITSRKNYENAMAESEEKFRQLADNINELCWLMEAPTGKVIYKNPAFVDFFGDNSSGESPSLDKMFTKTIAEDLPALKRLTDCSLTRLSREAEIRFVGKSGDTGWYVLKVKPVCSKKSNLHRYVGIAFEVTDLKQAEFKLKEALEVERKASEMKSVFVSMASHEFRTPLSSIKLSADLIRLYNKRMHEDDLLRHTSIITRKVKGLSNLIDKVLELSCIESGKISAEQKETDITTVLKSWLEEKQKNHLSNFKIKCISPEFPVRITLDSKLFLHVLDNLLSNSTKYSPSGTAICIKLVARDDRITVSIADHGVGIAPEEKDFLFDPFFRSSRVRHISGTGMGLPIVKKITESLNGKISVKSRVNRGTVFFIELPR